MFYVLYPKIKQDFHSKFNLQLKLLENLNGSKWWNFNSFPKTLLEKVKLHFSIHFKVMNFL